MTSELVCNSTYVYCTYSFSEAVPGGKHLQKLFQNLDVGKMEK